MEQASVRFASPPLSIPSRDESVECFLPATVRRFASVCRQSDCHGVDLLEIEYVEWKENVDPSFA